MQSKPAVMVGRGFSWTRFTLALAVGFSGALCEIFYDGPLLLMAPPVCAAAIGLSLPRKQLLLLVTLLSLAIFLPLLTQADQPQIFPRLVALACVWLIVVSSRSVDDRLGDTQDFGRSDEEAASELVDEPSTLIHAPPSEEDKSDRTTSGISHRMSAYAQDYARKAIERLKATGAFSDAQLELLASELDSLSSGKVTTSLQEGDTVGRFVIDGRLGRGGVGNVYRGHDMVSGEPAAIKILHNVRVSDRFRREMQMVQRLAHPNIVTAYEVGEFQGLPFITMELLKGPDLNVYVRDSGPLSWIDSTRYILQTTRALEHAHRRDLIHRDIKPGNIILNGEHLVKLVDLGLASMASDDMEKGNPLHETKEGHLAGTLAYMAPEQARSLASANVQSDIYSIGATWFYLLTGRTRLRGKSFGQQFENLLIKRRFNALPDDCLPKDLEKIYKKLTSYDPSRRYQDCSAVAADLEKALTTAGESVTAGDIKVLVVEDSQTDMMLTIEMLRRANPSVTIHQAKSLSEGLEAYNSMPIDLVLLDLTLPDSSGVDTVHRFRQSAAKVPLVVLTGMSDETIAKACIQAGANSFASKSGLSAHKMERIIFVSLSRYSVLPQPEPNPEPPDDVD